MKIRSPSPGRSLHGHAAQGAVRKRHGTCVLALWKHRASLALVPLLAPATASATAADYAHWGANALVVLSTLVVVVASILLHYIGLDRAWQYLDHRRGARRHRRVLYGILAALGLHVAQIWIFGLAYWLLAMWPETGHIIGADPLRLLDAVYLSAACFTTVGFGDLAPIGPLRFMAGTEALTGFLLITWSASFTFLEMDRFWRRRE